MIGYYLGLFLLIPLLMSAMSWSEPVNLSDSSLDATQASLSVSNSTGQAIAGWVLTRDSDAVIQISFFNESSWSAATTLSDSHFSSDQPSVGINSLGHAVAVWRKITSSEKSAIEASFFNGTVWSDPISVSDADAVDGVRFAIHPTQDAAVAVWRTGSGIASIQASLFDGMTWSAPASFAPDSAPINAQVGINADGTAVLSWISENTPTKSLYISTYSGSWSSPTAPVSANSDVISLALAIDPSANSAIALWSNLYVLQTSFWGGMSWNASSNLATSSSFLIDEAVVFHPTNHTAGAIWRASGALQSSIFVSSTWSSPITLASIGFSPDLGFNPSSGLVGAVWRSNDAIQFCEFNAVSASDPVNISGLSSNLEDPKIGFDSSGNATVLWSLWDGNLKIVQAVRGH
jgi:hypothetical protein